MAAARIDKAVEERFSEIFEHEVAVFFVATGSAANGLAMAAVNRPGGVIFCHRDCHMLEGECGGVEYLTGGARLLGLDGAAAGSTSTRLSSAVAELVAGLGASRPGDGRLHHAADRGGHALFAR